METGYLRAATTPDAQLAALERRVARLETALEKRDREAADRRMWRWYYAYSAYISIMIAVIVYLAASLK
jgi:hypothetical protein